MKCPRCGEESRESRIYCLKCGATLHGKEATSSDPAEGGSSNGGPKETYHRTRSRSCSNCGKYNREDAKYCARCGLTLDNPSVCPQCHGPIKPEDRYCPACGHLIRMEKLAVRSGRPIAALLFGLIPGLFSLWGIGHFFAGRFTKGLVFLLLGLVLLPFSGLFILSFAASLGLDWWGMVILVIVLGTVWIVLWLYQSLDAYHEAGGE